MAPTTALLGLLGASLVARAHGGANINAVTANRGSLAGGTYITVWGDGFFRNGQDGTTRVFVGVDEAQVVEYDSSDVKLVAYTPAYSAEATLSVRVGMVSIDGKASYAACPSAAACQFSYRNDATPTVDYMTLAGASGQTLRVYGRLLGLTTDAYTIRVGDADCDVSEDLVADSSRIIDSGSRTGTVKCFAGGPVEAGRYNLSVRVHDATAGYGAATFGARVQGVEMGSGQLYRFTVHPEVTSLSYDATGLGGGGELAIGGSGFSWDAADNTVTLAGVPCAVTSATPTELRCVPGPAAAATNTSVAPGVWYPGGRGLLHRLWSGATYAHENAINVAPTRSWINTDAVQGYSFNEAETFTQEMTGFFVPPVTANYSFWVRGDDYSVVWLSTTASPANRVRMAVMPGWSTSWAQSGTQVSAPTLLQAGQAYWFQARHAETLSLDYLDVGLRVHTEGNPAAAALFGTDNHLRYRSVPEHQRIAITTTVTREMQRFVVGGAASGSFTLAVGGSVRTDNAGQPVRLAFNAAESAVSSYVRAVIGCDSITVTRSALALPGVNVTGFAWNVTIGCPTDAAAWPAIVPYSVSLAPQAGVPEVTLESGRVRAASRPAGGFVRLAWNGNVASVNVPARAGGWQIRQALLSIPGLTDVEVWDSSTGTLDGGTWTIQINGPFGDAAPISVLTDDGNGTQWLTGTGAAATVTEVIKGSTDALLWPIPMDFFRAPLNANAAVVVTTNGIMGSCDATASNTTGGRRSNCTFAYDASLTPTIASADRTTVTAGDVITITGTGFLPASAGVGRGPGGTDLAPSELNAVRFGAVADACNVTAASATSLTCTVLHTPAGVYTLRVVVGSGRGEAVPAAPGGSLPTVTYAASIAGMAPSAGSLAGGTTLVITGTGFQPGAANNTVTVGGAACAISAATVTQITCLTPPAAGGPASAAVVVNGLPAGSGFAYAASLTGQLTAMAPAALSAAISGTLTLSLSNLGGIGAPALDAASYTITVGERPCRVVSLVPGGVAGTATVNCTLVRGAAAALPQAPLVPRVAIAGAGFVSTGSLALDAGFRVDAMSTARGSLAGGTTVVFTGAGFSTRLFQVEVSFDYVDVWLYEWSVSAEVTAVSADGTQVTAVVPAIPLWKRGRANSTTPQAGNLVLRVNNVTAPCASALAGCAFTQSIDFTPVITGVNASADGRTLTVAGANLWSVGGTTSVSIGPFACEGIVVAPAADSLTCAIPPATAGTYDVTAFVTGWGNGRSSASFTLPLSLGGGWPAGAPTRGSLEGGTPVVLSGAGFAVDDLARNVARFGAAPAAVLAANFTHLTLLSPPGAAGTVAVSVRVLDDVMTGAIAAEVTLPAAFTYDATLAFTPTLVSVTPRQGFAGQVVAIRGTGFGNASSEVAVTIGGVPCDLLPAAPFNASYLACALGAAPAGVHKVLVRVGSRGFARASPTPLRFTSLLEVTDQAGTNSGLGGGRLITISGRGFPTGVAEDRMVTVGACNTRCTVLSSSYERVVCASAPLVTREALSALRVWQPSALVPVRLPTGAAAASMDGAVETSFTSCTVDIDLGADTLAVMTSLRLYPKYARTRNAQGARFLGRASAGANWTTLATLSSQYVQEGWNEFNVEGFSPSNNYASVDWMALPAVRFLRFAFAAGAECTANELAFMGIPVSPASVCPLNVTVATTGGVMAPFTGANSPVTAVNASALIAYDLASTPVVTGITPEFGTALGGDVLTLAGSGFPASPADVVVALNGVPCTVLTSSPTAITCRTGARGEIMPVSVNVTVINSVSTGTALYDPSRVYFRYLDRWSALTTWKYQEPPVEGDSVVVPIGQSILVDVTPPKLFLVLVQGDLVFDRQDLTFDASYIFVHGGRFEVGTEAVPFTNKLTITLHGDRRESIEIPEVGAKMLVVMPRSGDHLEHGGMGAPSAPGAPQMAATKGYSQGFLELHGAPRKRVWTRLGAAIAPGSTIITTAEDVDWRAGETLLVTNTFNYGLTETVQVFEVLGPRTLRIKAPFANAHDCKIVPAGQYGQPDVPMCAEVALLSRNVIVRGDPDKSPRQLFGAHTGAMHGGVYHVENIELTHCGQQGLLGRYCTHFHMTSDNWDSYVRFNSIHHSFQRAVTIHATNHALVKHNVAYDVFGHTIFVEDGVERYNVIEENLVVHTKACGMCISSDKKPANFWMASPTCIWRHNVAGGSTHFGFWFELPNSPHGPSYTPTYCPVNMPLGEFFNNTAHSSSIGLRIYPQFFPMQNGCEGGGTAPQYLRNNTYFHNGQGMFHRNIGDLHHVNSRWLENGEDVSWKIYRGVGFTWDPNIVNGLFICNTNGNGGCGARAITAPQDEYWYAKDLTLVNYRTVGALAGCHSCNDDEDYKQGGYTYRWEGLKWVNTTVRTHWNEPRKCIFWDLDGSLTGFVNGMATPFYGWNNFSESGCPRDRVGTFKFATVCDGSVPIRRFQMDNFEPAQSLQWQSLNISSAAGFDLLPYRPKDFAGWSFPVVGNQLMDVRWARTLSDWQRLRIRYSEPAYLDYGWAPLAPAAEWSLARFSWIDYRWRNMVRYGSALTDPEIVALPAGQDVDPTQHAFGRGTHPNGTAQGNWTVAITTINATRTGASKYQFTVWNVQCPPNGCNVPSVSAPMNPVLWSDPAAWPGGVLPVAGSDVLINSTTYVIMDVNPPRLNRVTIEGRLDFQDSAARRLEASLIINWGSFNIGSPSAPFLNRAEVVIYGTRTSPAAIIDNNLFVSNKVIANLGNFTAVGRPLATTWTFLNATVLPGATTLTLARAVAGEWQAGDSVVISPTEYDASTVETAEIESVADNVVTLREPLTQRHYAGPAATSGVGAGVLLRAAVGLLTRNVVIRGNVTGPTDTYGAVIFTSTVRRAAASPRPAAVRTGRVDLRHVELRSMGKQNMEYPALHFQYGRFLFDDSVLASQPVNYLEGVSFNGGFNHALQAKAARGVNITRSVFYRTYRDGVMIDKDSSGWSMTHSLLVSNLRSPATNADEQTPWVVPQAAVYAEVAPARMSGNVVGGAIDAGFTIRPPACAASGATFGSGNEAHAVRIGAFLLSSPAGCVGLDGFRAWKASHVGVLTVDQQSNTVLRRMTVADCHIGVSLNFLRPGSQREEGSSRLEDSTLIGTSLATAGCGEATVCRAAGEVDVRGDGCGSVLGAGYRRAGLLLPQYTSKGKTCEFEPLGLCLPVNTPGRLCTMPWEKRYGVAGSAHVAQYLTNVRFAGFNGTECDGRRSRAVVHNPSQVDLPVPTYARGITWDAVPEGARFDFGTNGWTHPECADGQQCDSLNFINWRDEDGTLTGAGAGAHLLGPNPQLSFPSPRCSERSAWPGIVCGAGTTYRSAAITSVERDAGHLNLGALQVSRLPPGVIDFDDNSTTSAPRTTLSRGSLKEFCSKMDYWPQYPHMLVPGGTHFLYWPATEPGAIQYQLFSPDAADTAVIQLAIQRPYVWEMYVQECASCAPVQVPMFEPANRSDTTLPAVTDPAGTWLHNPQRRKIWFTVRGGNPARTYRLVRTPAIQVNMHLAISVTEFFGADLVDNLARLLGISRGQIKIVDVRPGSTVVGMEIRDEAPTVLLDASNGTDANATGTANATAAFDEQFARVGRLAQRLTTMHETGQLTTIGSIPVLALEITAPPEAWTAIGVDPNAGAPSGSRTSGLTAGEQGGLAAGVVLGFALVAGLTVVAMRRRSASTGADAGASTVNVCYGDGTSKRPVVSAAASEYTTAVAVQPGGQVPPAHTSGKGAAEGDFSGSNPHFAHGEGPAETAVAVAPGGRGRTGGAPSPLGGGGMSRFSTRVLYAPRSVEKKASFDGGRV